MCFRYGSDVMTRVAIIRGCAWSMLGKWVEAEQVLQSVAQDSDAVQLLRVQILIARGLLLEAVDLVSSVKGLRYQPALISTLFHLRQLATENSGTENAVDALWKDIQAFLSLDSSEVSDEGRVSLLRRSAKELVKGRRWSEAAAVLQALVNGGALSAEERVEVLAELVCLLSYHDSQAAEKLVDALPRVSAVCTFVMCVSVDVPCSK